MWLIYMLMRDEKEGRKKQARSYKQQSKAIHHTQGTVVTFSKGKMSCLGWDSNPRHSRQSTLLLSYRGSSAGWAHISYSAPDEQAVPPTTDASPVVLVEGDRRCGCSEQPVLEGRSQPSLFLQFVHLTCSPAE